MLTTTLSSDFIKLNSKDTDKLKKISFSESTIIKKNQNNFEQNNYEQIMIKNMSELLADKLISYLSRN